MEGSLYGLGYGLVWLVGIGIGGIWVGLLMISNALNGIKKELADIEDELSNFRRDDD